MSSLLSQINEQADTVLSENEIIDTNIGFLAEYLSMTTDQLNEAVSTWLAKVRNSVASGKFDIGKHGYVSAILGALEALTNPDLANKLDKKGDLGTILYNAGGKDKMMSNAALQRLMALAKEPEVAGFVNNAVKAMDDPGIIDAYTKRIQMKIEPIMNKRIAAERKAVQKPEAAI